MVVMVAAVAASLVEMAAEVNTTVLQTPFDMKNGVFWDVTPCGSCKNRRFGGT
jgi:hypothetical protein